MPSDSCTDSMFVHVATRLLLLSFAMYLLYRSWLDAWVSLVYTSIVYSCSGVLFVEINSLGSYKLGSIPSFASASYCALL